MRDIGKNILGKKKTFNHYLKQTTMIIIPQSNVDFSDLPKHTLTAIIIGFNFLFLASFCILYYFFIKEGYNGSFWDWALPISIDFGSRYLVFIQILFITFIIPKK